MESKIGTAAGEIWRALKEGGPMSPRSLTKATDMKSELLNQAIGWLAREGKIEIRTEGKKQLLSLKS